MTAAGENDVIVSYSVRDLFERVDSKLVGIDQKLDAKADKADLDRVELEVSRMRLWQAKVVGAALAVGGLSGGGVGALIEALSK